MHTEFKSENLKGRDHMVSLTGRGRIKFMYICEYAGAGFEWLTMIYSEGIWWKQ
jgi:hypothetical protein